MKIDLIIIVIKLVILELIIYLAKSFIRILGMYINLQCNFCKYIKSKKR